ncbi:angiopoietin-1 receptor-like [Dreissena polymorpha]|uniref:angiopoietin-1 receptor-like n=1 Tax=Dreissena polymorpha TaxID=45954 RepID=UPI0022651EE8|nr:angiopoietin-1 receptor-like [Dreissena polymorpha]
MAYATSIKPLKPANSSCYFYLFWLGNTHKAQELKILRDFTWQVTDLEYSTNYSIQLYSYDETFKDSSTNTKFLFHMTPDCLEVTNYNLSICAPLRPENVLLEVTTPNHEDELIRTINVSLSWQPPLHTHNGHDVRYYEVIYSKKPPMNEPHKIRPDKGTLSNIPPSNRRIDIVGLHNHNLYRFELYAVTLGGRGEPAELQKFIGLTGTELLDVIELRNATPKATYTERLKAEELLSIVVVPVVLFFVLFFVICFVFLRRRQKYQGFAVTRKFGHVEELNPIYDDSPINIAVKTGAFAADNYEIDYSCLDFISVIGEGAFGKVVKAEYYSKPNDRDSKAGKIVAVKMLRDYYTGDESRSFLMEIQAMKNLGHHPYIVSMIGCCLTGPNLCLVMDYCVHGDLRNYLRKYREKLLYNMSSTFALVSKAPKCYRQDQLLLANEKRSDSCSSNTDLDEVIEVSEAQLLSYARQITMGMEFLEQRKFVHRDLAARNILLFDQRHIKISDFGLTRDVYETNVYQPTSARKLPYKWMAIESLFSQRFTIKSDIWSFGIVLWEIVTLGGSPYPSIPLKDLYGLLKDGYRMEKPENCSTKIYQIMLSCWHPNAHSRPSFVQLRLDLEKLLEETRSYIDLTVEVSDDYFNESVNESNLSRDVIQNISLAETSEGQEYIESKQLCVDIHDDPRTDKDRLTGSITHGKEQFKSRVYETNDKRARYVTRTFQNNSVVKKSSTEMKVQGECSVCATSIDIGSKTDMCDSATRMCEICSTQMQLDKTFSYPKTAKHKLTSINSLKDNFKDIFETITLGSPKLKSKQTQKKSVSLTDIRNMGNVRTTAL